MNRNLPRLVCPAWPTGWFFLASLISTLASPVPVACVGDSITWGYGISNREHNSYPAQLAALLGTNWVVRNFGVNATTLLHQGDLPYVRQPAWAQALAFKPDVVVIDFGANDSKHPGDGSLEAERAVNNWQYKTNFVHDYEEMIAAFRQANPAARIFICLPTPDYPGRWGINNRTIRVEMMSGRGGEKDDYLVGLCWWTSAFHSVADACIQVATKAREEARKPLPASAWWSCCWPTRSSAPRTSPRPRPRNSARKSSNSAVCSRFPTTSSPSSRAISPKNTASFPFSKATARSPWPSPTRPT
jgi:lysophospholipase L1-like esterase